MNDRFERISLVDDPDDRLNSLRLELLSTLDATSQAPPNERELPLVEILGLATTALEQAVSQRLSSDAAALYRVGHEQLIRLVSFYVFSYFEICFSDSTEFLSTRSVLSAGLAAESIGVLEGYRWFLMVSSAWMLRHFRTSPLPRALSNLSRNEQTQFRRQLEDLASKLSLLLDSYDLGAAGLEEKLNDSLFDLRWLRNVAQAADRRDRPLENCAESRIQTDRDGHLYLLNLSPFSRLRLVGGVIFVKGGARFWTSRVWTDLVAGYEKLRSLGDPPRDEYDTFLSAYSEHPHLGLGTLLGSSGDRPTPDHIQLVDFTRSQLPLSCLIDPECAVSFSIAGGMSQPVTAREGTSIGFCGDFPFPRYSELAIDETERCVIHLGKSRVMLRYPDLRLNPDEGFRGLTKPLVYSCYERWFLQDLCEAVGVPLQVFSGAKATRHAFLSTCWDAVSVLHITTHGESFGDVAELANIWLAEERDRPTRLTYLDVLSRDWSGMDLVFLNACLTGAGKKGPGEEALSLAWAFRSSGARSVIAARWEVDEEAAWYFARSFYQMWLLDERGSTVRDAFQAALRRCRSNPRFASLSRWAPFVLLEG